MKHTCRKDTAHWMKKLTTGTQILQNKTTKKKWHERFMHVYVHVHGMLTSSTMPIVHL